MVYAVAFGVLNNREAARDAAQEAFIKAYREIVNFHGDSKFKTWLYRVTVNAAIDEARKRKPLQSLDAPREDDEGGPPEMALPDTSPGAREHVYQGELRDWISAAIELLSPEHRAVLVLREFQELSYEEIAETLGLQMGTVMSRLFYARKKLAQILSGPEQEKKTADHENLERSQSGHDLPGILKSRA